MYYINYKYYEKKINMTLEYFETESEAKLALYEYRHIDPFGTYWISRRCCKVWSSIND
jgi:hypothetical protein